MWLRNLIIFIAVVIGIIILISEIAKTKKTIDLLRRTDPRKDDRSDE